jgi:hypothetical protein
MDRYVTIILIVTDKYNRICHILRTHKLIDAHTNEINWVLTHIE